MEILYSFIGCCLAQILFSVLKWRPKKQQTNDTEVKRKQVDDRKFSDMLYGQYVDKDTKLYKTYVPTKKNRRGEIDE